MNEARGELKEITKRFEGIYFSVCTNLIITACASPHSELNVPMQYDISVQMKLWEKCMGLKFRVTEGTYIYTCTVIMPKNPIHCVSH